MRMPPQRRSGLADGPDFANSQKIFLKKNVKKRL
jgi:hypothetical protein